MSDTLTFLEKEFVYSACRRSSVIEGSIQHTCISDNVQVMTNDKLKRYFTFNFQLLSKIAYKKHVLVKGLLIKSKLYECI